MKMACLNFVCQKLLRPQKPQKKYRLS